MVMKRLSEREILQFQNQILEWYRENQRDLPWRRTRDPYKILVSEIMLQQTQVSRVMLKYEAWLTAFPSVTALAKAKTAEVLRLWSGLGYNRRALYLQKCAQALNELRIKNYESRNEKDTYWPREIGELKKLPGIGEYTSAAVACFAFDQQVAVIDTNIRKIIILLLTNGIQLFSKNKELRMMNKDKIQKRNHNSLFIIPYSKRNEQEFTLQEIKEIANILLPVGKAADWNQALMDYASAMLKKEKILQSRTKQSKFKDSNRYYRGQILKLLLQKKMMTIQELMKQFQKDAAFIEMIVSGLEKDEMVKRGENSIRFTGD